MPSAATLTDRLPPAGELLADAAEVFDRFLDYTTELGLELYPAQEEALLALCEDQNVILNTPTGSGKSLVALALHFLAMARDERSVYTSPVKALVNEKFFALCEAFGPDNVGLLTGDATVNRDAPILCCTAEILANWALGEGEQADVSYAVLDEFHYYSDPERGVAWQVPLLTLPQTTFLLMSATLGDTTFFEEKLTRLNGKASVTVKSRERPVPLDYAYSELPLHETIGRLVAEGRSPVYVVNFTQKACHVEAQSLTSANVCTREQKQAVAAALGGWRYDTPYGKELGRLLRHGIGVHHGGMLPKYCRQVERLAQRGLLQVICGTDTLGVGVNIPIRTVVLTQLSKFDGAKTRLLGAREFHQISGRAGRKGFDDRGSVVAQAPAHVIENLWLAAKAAGDPKKLKRIVRKKPPTKGYVHYDRATFERLVKAEPEPLVSSFQVSHAMLLNVLGRPEGGCRALKRLIGGCHERRPVRVRLGRTAMQMFRALCEADVITFVEDPEAPARKRVRVNVDLQQDFSLYHALSLYLVETIAELPRDIDSYPLDVLSIVEAILENPTPVLLRQLDRIKGEQVARMKADGVDYEERMRRLEEIDYPKPNASFIYATFNEFAARHPWAAGDNVRPKAVARELYERCLDFRTMIADLGLERAEGILLRYLTEVYKALVQNVPEWARTPELDDLTDFFGSVVRGVDSSLLDEWECLRDPSYVPAPPAPAPEPEPEPERGITADEHAFVVLCRNAAFAVVRAIAARDFAAAAALVAAPADEPEWTAARLEQAMAPYFAEHESVRTDPRARGTDKVTLDTSPPGYFKLRQTLCDPAGHDDWAMELRVDLASSDAEARPVLRLERVGD